MIWAFRVRERGRRMRGDRPRRGRPHRVDDDVEGAAKRLRAAPSAQPGVRRRLGPAMMQRARSVLKFPEADAPRVAGRDPAWSWHPSPGGSHEAEHTRALDG